MRGVLRCIPRLALLGALTLAATGCYGTVGYRGHVYVPSAPPAPYVEVVGTAPGPSYTWVNGYWWWNGNEYVWIRGQWSLPPQPGYVYVRSGWVHTDGHYRFVHGRWVTPSHRPRVRYVHPTPRVRVETGVHYRTVRPDRRRGTVRVRPRR